MKKVVGITIGDPSGVGPEIILKSLIVHKEIYETCKPVVFGPPELLKAQMEACDLKADIIQINKINQSIEPSSNTLYCYTNENNSITPPLGVINADSGHLAFRAIVDSIECALNGDIEAVATAPINKEALNKARIPFLDQTEIFSKKTNSKNPMILFMVGNLRIFFLTRHLRFSDISSALRIDDIVVKLKFSQKYLKKLGINNPKIALAALNPHAGEAGMFGDEEIGVLTPAIKHAQKNDVVVDGPIAADSVFHLCKEGYYDAVLSLYHDQGHIAAKSYDFYKTISLTMGLPFLRTSVDHGTAMDLAGKNMANEISMVEAIKAAAKYSWKLNKIYV